MTLTAQRKVWGGMHGGLMRYRNQTKAERAIQHGYVKPELLCRLEALRCDECGGWHVIQIPLPPIDVDKAYGMCTTKKAYLDEDMARRVARSVEQERGAVVRPYACPFCGLWHLTKAGRLETEDSRTEDRSR